ncbi:MAG: heavy metal translocating P-type ATPase [Desulfurispora sp.]|uniref:heavy metal translocating P-type ATPase n=1 Tax=Desulfurispora sp. TaxID=3014275 RepID=UPI00404B6665
MTGKKSIWRYYGFPGRLRVSMPEIYYQPLLARAVTRRLEGVAGIKLVAANPRTGRSLILYDPRLISLEKIQRELARLRRDLLEKHPSRLPGEIKEHLPEPEDDPLATQALRLWGTGAVLAGLTVRRAVRGTAAYAASPLLFNLSTATTLISAYPMLYSGFSHVARKLRINHDLLLGLASFALLVSRESLLGLTVLWLSHLSAYIQTWVLQNSQNTLKKIARAARRSAVDRVSVQPGSGRLITVHNGQRVSVSGRVIQGKALVDEAAVTGSPLLMMKQAGDGLLAGSFIRLGQLTLEPDAAAPDLVPPELERELQKSSVITRERAAANEYAEKITRVALVAASATYLLSRSFSQALAVIMAATPAAISLAVVTAYRAGLVNATRQGILFKDLQALELLTETDAVLLDKTGVLTHGRPLIQEAVPVGWQYTSHDILELAAACTRELGHPVARSLVEAVPEQVVRRHRRSGIQVMVGQGVSASVDGRTVLVGNRQLMQAQRVDIEPGEFKARRLHRSGCSVTYVALDGKLVGLIGLRDRLRSNSRRFVEQLRNQGIADIGIITGDAREAAVALGRELNIGQIYAELLPQDKAGIVARLQARGKIVTVVGDGLNDIPALAHADIGIVLGSQPEAFMLDAARVVITGPNLSKINQAIHIARLCSEVVRQNQTIAAGANIVGMGLAVGNYLSPIMATVLSNLSSLAVLLNSARLLNRRPGTTASSHHTQSVFPGPYAGSVPHGAKGSGSNVNAPLTSRPVSSSLSVRKQNNFSIIPDSHATVRRMWYEMAEEEVITYLGSHPAYGLSLTECQRRLQIWGSNQIGEARRPSAVALFWEQLQNLMSRLLLGASLGSFILGELTDGFSILLVVFMQAVVGAIQEYRAEKALNALKQLAAPTARVVRAGQLRQIPAGQLVPGDIILLEAGDLVPADCRLLEVVDLAVQEDMLTGESTPVVKQTGICRAGDQGLAVLTNMVFMGSRVVRGRGRAVVTDTGRYTEMGQIATMLAQVENETTPLQKQLHRLGQELSLTCIGICGLITAAGIARGQPGYEMLRTGISLAVGAIPEGLPAIVTIALAFGVQRMVRRNAVVRRLPAVETLAYTTVICSDKTGTLTSNQMAVTHIYANNRLYLVKGNGYNPIGSFWLGEQRIELENVDELQRVLLVAALCNNAALVYQPEIKEWTVQGDPTEGALLVAAARGGYDPVVLQQKYPRQQEIPFDSERRMMAVVVENQRGQRLVLVKGAPDEVLERCRYYSFRQAEQYFSHQHRQVVHNTVEQMARDALRVVALAYKFIPVRETPYREDELLNDLTFAGLMGMQDPPRPDVQAAVSSCKQAGIKVVMITGDHCQTALAVARQLRILQNGLVMSGQEIDGLSDRELLDRLDRLEVVYRASPRQKLRLVRVYKQRGYVVAMTGDGVNDAPALKEADVGIAMGRCGTDVTREASCITLTDDSFSTIVAAIEEGRAIKANIRKFVRYVLAGNLGEVLAVSGAVLLGLPVCLDPAHILWVNVVTESIPALALGMDPPAADSMQQLPSPREENLFSRDVRRKVVGRGLGIGTTTLGIYTASLALKPGQLTRARTLALANLVTGQLFNVFDSRECRVPNRFLMPAVGLSAGLLLGAIYLPGLQTIMRTAPLSLYEWGVVLLGGGVLSRWDCRL